jgi:hypothetical protein
MKTQIQKEQERAYFKAKLEKEKAQVVLQLLEWLLFLILVESFPGQSEADLMINGLIFFGIGRIFYFQRIKDMNMDYVEERLKIEIKKEERAIKHYEDTYKVLSTMFFKDVCPGQNAAIRELAKSDSKRPQEILDDKNDALDTLRIQHACYGLSRERTFWQYVKSLSWMGL